MPLTPEEGRRLHVLNLLDRGQITTAQAAEALVLGDGVAFVNLHWTRAGPEPRRPSGAPPVVHRRPQQVPANLEAHRVDRTISDKFTKATP